MVLPPPEKRVPVKTIRRPRILVETLTESVQCNVCGLEVECPDAWPSGMRSFKLEGWYGGECPTDGDTVSFVACASCLSAWVNAFQIPPNLDSVLLSGGAVLATHSESGVRMIVEDGWVRPEGVPIPDPSSVAAARRGAQACIGPGLGVWQHFKGRLYEVFDWAWTVDSPHELMVVYRGLYDDNPVYVRPVYMWAETVVRDGYSGPRFRPAGGVG